MPRCHKLGEQLGCHREARLRWQRVMGGQRDARVASLEQQRVVGGFVSEQANGAATVPPPQHFCFATRLTLGQGDLEDATSRPSAVVA